MFAGGGGGRATLFGCSRRGGDVCVPCAGFVPGGAVRAGVGVPAGYVCWSTIFVAESDSHVKVNWVLGVAELAGLVADCSKLTLSLPLPEGVSGPCSAAVLMAWEMIPPVFSMPGSVFDVTSANSVSLSPAVRFWNLPDSFFASPPRVGAREIGRAHV